MMKNVRKYAQELINDSLLNKGSAFTKLEREKFQLSGLLPHSIETIGQQVKRQIKLVEGKSNDLEKYTHLMEILNRNETLFYKLIRSDIKRFMPLIYTPTVGEACQNFSSRWSQPRGMYITRQKGMTEEDLYTMLCNWRTRDIKAIVFTDGQRILGLGDLGINGMGIPMGKLQLYSACAGISPSQCLPVVIDNGTNNKELHEDEFYLGKKEKRQNDPEYHDFINLFMNAAKRAFGDSVLLQFEDFGNDTAFDLLNNNQYNFNCFNDDIQGTASVALAGILASLKMNGVKSNLAEHRILFLGAGEAGAGIGELVAYAIEKETNGIISKTKACSDNVFFVDSKGLISTSRKDKLAHHKEIFQNGSHATCDTFIDAIREIKPTMIIGVSAQPKMFTKEVCQAMAELNDRPVIFALSNPTNMSECTAEEAYKWTNNRCIFASGSPFPQFRVEELNKTISTGQGNNAYIFPGVALGAIAIQSKFIPDELFYIAAETLASHVTKTDREKGAVYPPLESIRSVSLDIATEVAYACLHPMQDPRDETQKITLATKIPDTDIRSKSLLKEWISLQMDNNEY